MIKTIKLRQHRPVLIIAGLMLVYLWFFSWPEFSHKCQRVWCNISRLYSDPALVGLLVVDCLSSIAGAVIWFLSVFVAWAAFRKSRKKGYVFILAFLLLPLVTEPASRLLHHLTLNKRLEAYEQLQAAGELPPPDVESPVPYTVVEHKVTLPVGPLLLLAGVWYLYKKENAKDDESGRHD